MVVGGWWINPLQTLPQGLVLTFDFDFDPDPDPELDNYFMKDETQLIIRGTFNLEHAFFLYTLNTC